MLSLTVAGTLGADPETRDAGSGTVTSFRVAVNGWDGRKKEKTTTWVKVTVWGKRGESLGALLHKGDKLCACGVAQLSKWTNRDGVEQTTLELNASDITPMGKAGGSQEAYQAPAPRGLDGQQRRAQNPRERTESARYDAGVASRAAAAPKSAANEDDFGDDIPF